MSSFVVETNVRIVVCNILRTIRPRQDGSIKRKCALIEKIHLFYEYEQEIDVSLSPTNPNCINKEPEIKKNYK